MMTTSPVQAGFLTAHTSTLTPTNFALEASGYSTRVVGGDVPASSDRSAFQVIGCTNLAGKSKTNFEANVDLSPLGSADAARTVVRTTENNGVVSSFASNSITSATLSDPSNTSTVTLDGVKSTARAFHDGTGFNAEATRSVAAVFFDADGSGPAPREELDVPTPGNPVEVPGVVKISLGPVKKDVNATGASIQADAVRVQLFPSGTVVYLAHSRATINGGVVSGLFRGSAFASKATAAGGRVTSGKTPYIVMPCQGTDGEVIRRDIARVNPKVIVNGVVAKGLHADQSADQTRLTASGYERGRVDRLRIGEGTDRVLAVSGIVGRANVHFVRGEGITTDAKGSQILGVTLNGERQRFGADGVIEIANLAKLEQHIVKRTKLTIQVTELRVTLLGGTNQGTVIDLGVAKVGFSTAGL
jgi:hypothetical protein